jgi:hypothetical protein
VLQLIVVAIRKWSMDLVSIPKPHREVFIVLNASQEEKAELLLQ